MSCPNPHALTPPPGTTRTLGTYSNDVAVLGDTEEDGALLPNNDT
jgi:hypothetical protein